MAKNAPNPTLAEQPDRFDVVAPHEYTHNGEQRTEWFRCGVAFPIKNGGFTLKLRTVPVAVDGEVTLVVTKREPKDKGTGDDYNLPG